MNRPLRIVIWNEYRHERANPKVTAIYPEGIHSTLQRTLQSRGGDAWHVSTATLDEPEHGLSPSRLAETDVLLWWGHMAHDEVHESVVERVHRRVLEGMGLIALHSAHASRIFQRLMGTSCMLRWRDRGERERLWVVHPGHPIVEGLGSSFEIPQAEMYGEYFDIPAPDELILLSWFEGGDVFRSGCTFRRGKGRIFYFRPGHELFPIFHQPEVQQVIGNAVAWCAPRAGHYRYEAEEVAVFPTPPADGLVQLK